MLRAPLASHPCLGRSLLPLQRSSSSSLGQAATIETRSRQRPLQSTSSYSSASSLSSCFWSFPSISSRPLDSRTTARSSTAWTASKKNLAEISKSNGTVTSGRSSYSTSTSPTSGGERSLQLTAEERDNQVKHSGLLRYINAYRTWGHLEAKIDPLGRKERKAPSGILDPSLYGVDKLPADAKIPLAGLLSVKGKTHATPAEITQLLRDMYCGTIGVEYTHAERPEEQLWFAKRFEEEQSGGSLSPDEKRRVLDLLQRSEEFDHFVHTKFRAVKRYGLEGAEAMMPVMETIFSKAASAAYRDVVISMPHRGRLNFLTGLLEYPAANIFSKVSGFSDAPDPKLYGPGCGDVLSHIAQSVDLSYEGKKLHVSLIHNPSHLEASNPVAMGKSKAKNDEGEKGSTLCLMVHGDAAFAAQGVIAETFTLSQLPEYSVGGSMHLIVNNQLGFTTDAHKGRSTSYSSDIGRSVHTPAIHVNAEDPEAVVRATRIAMDYIRTWKRDVILDLNGYRRHGHNELDEPAFTQPLMYNSIRARPSIVTSYADKLVEDQVITKEQVQEGKDRCRKQLDKEYAESQRPRPSVDVLSGKWKSMKPPSDMTATVETGIDETILSRVGLASINTHGKNIHSRLQNFFCGARKTRIEAKTGLDWATAEALAVGSLLLEGHNVRLSGQDVGRGTFSHRHWIMTDQASEEKVIPLNHIDSKQGRLSVADSPLSEFAVTGFEYGYSAETPNSLVMWEAQFGDFSNCAQIVIDQFICSGEDKWWRQSGLTFLLPHGYDGAGPEHSSCRIERYLQLCDGDRLSRAHPSNKITNMTVAFPTTPANYFHLLRRQMKRQFRKPLIVVGPKALLRAAGAVSDLSEMGPGTSFRPLIPETSLGPSKIKKVIICTGKVYYDLLKFREQQKQENTAILRVEELSPFPYAQLEAELVKYGDATTFRWVQEEPQNMGAWEFVNPRIDELLRSSLPNTQARVRFVGREAAAAPAVGISSVHAKQHQEVLEKAFQ